jgi:hypothetical protein
VPAEIPVTVPALTVAFALEALHTPPVVASVSTLELPAQMAVAPEIAATTGNALTVTTSLAVPVPVQPALVTVTA